MTTEHTYLIDCPNWYERWYERRYEYSRCPMAVPVSQCLARAQLLVAFSSSHAAFHTRIGSSGRKHVPDWLNSGKGRLCSLYGISFWLSDPMQDCILADEIVIDWQC